MLFLSCLLDSELPLEGWLVEEEQVLPFIDSRSFRVVLLSLGKFLLEL